MKITLKQIMLFIFKPIIMTVLAFVGYSLMALSVFNSRPVFITLGFIALMPLMVEIIFELLIDSYSGFSSIEKWLKERK
jgi:hypothetical protein